MPQSSEAALTPAAWPLWMRVLASVIVLFHLLAVFIGPFTFASSFGPGMASPFAEPILRGLRPYIDLLYLNHGYFFFAPNPGPSHLLRAELSFADGQPNRQITLPDLETQRPRLLYHRHFMLAEQLHAEFAPPQLPPELEGNTEAIASWQRARELYEVRRRSIEEHLRHRYGATHVTLTRVEHRLLAPAEFTDDGKPIDAPDTYIDLNEEGLPGSLLLPGPPPFLPAQPPFLPTQPSILPGQP